MQSVIRKVQIAFPLQKGTSGYFKVSSNTDSVQGRLIQLLETNPGERVHLCDFGVGLTTYLFDPMDSLTVQQINARISEQMSRYEPNLTLIAVKTTPLTVIPPIKLSVQLVVEEKATKNRLEFIFDYSGVEVLMPS